MRKKILAFVFAAALPVGVALVIGIAMFAAVGMLSSPRQAEASHKVVVVISGDVTFEGVPGLLPLHVGAQASGPAGSLTGQGFDLPPGPKVFGEPGDPVGYCRIPLTGTLVGTTVTLSGVVNFAHNPGDLGVPVNFTADASTGFITFDFGGFIFEGTGRVRIAGHR